MIGGTNDIRKGHSGTNGRSNGSGAIGIWRATFTGGDCLFRPRITAQSKACLSHARSRAVFLRHGVRACERARACVCVRACVRACVRVCARARV